MSASRFDVGLWIDWGFADNSGVHEGGRAGRLGRTGLVVCLWVAL